MAISIEEARDLLKSTFKGADVVILNTMGGTEYITEAHFADFEIRIILSGSRRNETRPINFRFLRKVLIKRTTHRDIINQMDTEDIEDLKQAIEDAKAHLVGRVYVLQRALRGPFDIGDLF